MHDSVSGTPADQQPELTRGEIHVWEGLARVVGRIYEVPASTAQIRLRRGYVGALVGEGRG